MSDKYMKITKKQQGEPHKKKKQEILQEGADSLADLKRSSMEIPSFASTQKHEKGGERNE